MEIIYLLIPMALVLVAVIVAAFMWAVHSGQFDDMEGPAHSILMDDDGPVSSGAPSTPAAREREHKTSSDG
jgi:cbb3-type cytochrome oxidase maturation protein